MDIDAEEGQLPAYAIEPTREDRMPDLHADVETEEETVKLPDVGVEYDAAN